MPATQTVKTTSVSVVRVGAAGPMASADVLPIGVSAMSMDPLQVRPRDVLHSTVAGVYTSRHYLA